MTPPDVCWSRRPAIVPLETPRKESPQTYHAARIPEPIGRPRANTLQPTARLPERGREPTATSTRNRPFHVNMERVGVIVALTLRQTCPRPKPRAQYAFKDSMIHVQRRSHYVSHFAAFFIVARAKISVVESCLGLIGPVFNTTEPALSLQHV